MTAAIVETRINYRLPAIIEQHRKFLPDKDRICLFTDEAGYNFYSGKIEAQFYIIDPINNLPDYNRLLTSIDFWEFEDDEVLIFQADSMLLRDGIEEFYGYDFIGAPIKNIAFPAMNGGLSLRSQSAMIKCINHRPWNPSLGNEDIYFCHVLQEIGGSLPGKEVASKFSVETIFNLGSLGYHACDKYLTVEQVKQIKTQYD